MMDGSGRGQTFELGAPALGQVMPMHLILDQACHIRGTGPTLTKLLGAGVLGAPLESVFSTRMPARVDNAGHLLRSQRLLMNLRAPPGTGFKGVAVPLGGEGGVLVNLSFGYAVRDAVRDHGLSATDFAPTDLAIELLYLHEAKAAVMGEVTRMADRLQGAKARAEAQAVTDALTGLGNRRAMEVTLQRMLATDDGFALLHLDLDYFKQVNDTLGHAAGDHVLVETAARLRACVRGADLVARVGGDEFVILLAGVSHQAPVQRVGAQILRRMAEGIVFQGRPCRVAISIGAVLRLPGQGTTGEALLERADAALYASKGAGRARLSFAKDDGSCEVLLSSAEISERRAGP
jgi:diguanylate cyclase (GGDEF)-like protein